MDLGGSLVANAACGGTVIYEKIYQATVLFFRGLCGSWLPVAAAHGEGRAAFVSLWVQVRSQGMTRGVQACVL